MRAGLTQEEVAQRAGLSARAIGDLERGLVRRPQRKTVELLIRALALPAADANSLSEAARRPVQPVESAEGAGLAAAATRRRPP
jgi:transcriptional regulator with XRE-family HTH domain